MWLHADRLVRDCLDDVRAGKVISVPGPQYKLLVGMSELAPRGLLHALATRAATARLRKRQQPL